MKRIAPFVLAAALPCSAIANDDIYIEFIGEATFPTGFTYGDTEVGGLSGIDYDSENDRYIAISDDRAEPRYYELTVDLSDGYLDHGDVAFTGVTTIYDSNGELFEPFTVDPESIRLSSFPGLLYWTSEGDANAGIAPFVRIMTRMGQPVNEFELPEKFYPSADSGIRQNLAFESLTFTKNEKRLVTATENALIQDGPAASLEAGSPVRVLTMKTARGDASKEYIYMTDAIPHEPVPAGSFATNGLVELLSIGKGKYIAVERAFSVGVGNDIKLYLTTTGGATNVKKRDSIDGKKIKPMKKQLLLDLAELGIVLDNIEGITFGPQTLDGWKTLILVSDNNFNPNGQFTQFLAFKLNLDD
jgi:3-phytase/alkaline phosphatase D